MASLYEIEQNLLNLFDEIENNGGEITPEQEDLLTLRQEDFRVKIDGYVKYIKSIDSKITASKNEIDRVKAFSKSQESKRKRLETAVKDGLLLFGDTNKTGNKFIEGSTYKVATRANQSVELNNDLIATIIEKFFAIITEMSDGVLGVDDLDLKGIADTITANILADSTIRYMLNYKEETSSDGTLASYYTPITEDDLLKINLEFVTTPVSFNKLCDKHNHSMLEFLVNYDYMVKKVPIIDKSIVKPYIKDNCSLLGKVVINHSLNIK